MAMMHALVTFSFSPRLGIWGASLELMDIGVDKRGNLNVHVTKCSIHFRANSCVYSCVCCSAHGSGCVVDGGSATAAIIIIIGDSCTTPPNHPGTILCLWWNL